MHGVNEIHGQHFRHHPPGAMKDPSSRDTMQVRRDEEPDRARFEHSSYRFCRYQVRGTQSVAWCELPTFFVYILASQLDGTVYSYCLACEATALGWRCSTAVVAGSHVCAVPCQMIIPALKWDAVPCQMIIPALNWDPELSRIVWCNKYQGCSRVMTRPADHVRRLSRSRGSSGVGSGGACDITGRDGLGRVGPGRKVSKSRGSGQVTLTRPDP